MKRLRIGRKRARVESAASPLELALAPALVDGRWEIPDRFNFTRDVVEALSEDPKRRAVTFSGHDGIIEPRTFKQLADGAGRWATVLRERDIGPADRVAVLVASGAEWLHIVLGCIKVGAVTVPCAPSTPASALEARLAATGASLVIADHLSDRERAHLSFSPELYHLGEDGVPGGDVSADAQTHDTSTRDVAFILSSSGTTSGPREVAHTHGAAFAARVQAEHWLDANRGDAVWCTADPGSAQAVWTGLLAPWSRGAELVLHHGEFDPLERLDLIHRLGVTILCQTPAEYRALAQLRGRDLERYQSRRLRRLVSTGDYLEPDVVAVFEEAWGMTIHDGYGQAETNVVVANGVDAGFKPGSLGLPLPGHHVAVVDGQGNELPPGIEGDLAVRSRTPSLFAGYWESPEETKAAYTGDWYVTGDVASRDEDGFLWFVGRASDVIASRGRTFGPHEVERVLREHASVRSAAVVGVRDLERGGHFVRAFVVLEPRVTASEQLAAALRGHVGDALAEHHVPREVEFVGELPVTAVGKINREALRETAVVGRPLWDAAPVEAEAAAPAVEEVQVAPPPLEPSIAYDAPAEVDAPEPEEPPTLDVPLVAFEPMAEPLVEPVAFREPEPEPAPPPVVEPEPSPPPIVEPEPLEQVVEAAPEPPVEAAPEPVVEPEPVAVPEPEPLVEAEPVAAEAAEVVAQPAAAAPEPEPLPDYVVDPATMPGVAPTPPPPESEPEEEEDLGPLPEYVVDPDRPRLEPVAPPAPEPEPEPSPAPEVAEETPEPESPLAGLGLKPVTEFPRRQEIPERETPSTKRRAPAPTAKADRDRSEGEPGDESEEIGWMQGLSSRLSAYSLGADLEAEEAPDADEDDPGPEPEADESAT